MSAAGDEFSFGLVHSARCSADIGMLTGEVGAGKTTVCHHLTAPLHQMRYRGHYVSLTTGNVLDTTRPSDGSSG